MLFILTDSLIGYTPEQKTKVLIGVANLLVGYYEGKNLILISDDFYNHFSSVLSDERALLSLRHLHSYTSYDYNVGKSFKVILNGPCHNDELLIDYFYNTASIQPVKIIGENSNDVEFYAIATQIMRHVDKEYLSYTNVHGGGYTTAGRLKDCQEKNEIALCIVDSDIKFPKAGKGATCGEIEAVYDSDNKHVFLVVIKVHEIENLLPPKFIAERAKKERRNIAQKFIVNGNEKYFRWYDIKSGISIADIGDPDYNDFAIELYENIYKEKRSAYARFIRQCKRNNKKLFPELADGLVKKFLKLPFEKQRSYSIFFKNEWKEIANNFYDFACSREKSPINI